MNKNIFGDQKPYENIILILRRHPLVLVSIVFAFVITGIIPILVLGFVSNLLPSLPEVQDLLTFASVVYYLLWTYGLFYELTDFFLDVWIVTDHRIVDIQQIGLFNRDVSETRLDKVQDVTTKITGYFPTFFNYGNVIIQTAGTEREFEFQQVPDPVFVKDTILYYSDQFRSTHIDGIEVHEFPVQ